MQVDLDSSAPVVNYLETEFENLVTTRRRPKPTAGLSA